MPPSGTPREKAIFDPSAGAAARSCALARCAEDDPEQPQTDGAERSSTAIEADRCTPGGLRTRTLEESSPSQVGKRDPRGGVAAHPVHPAAGRCRGRAQVHASQRRPVRNEAPDRPEEELTEV